MCGIAIDGKWAAELKRSAMSLGTRILKLQDEERRKIGRESDDSLGQYLAALKMNLIALKETSAACEEARGSAECISDCVTLVGQCLQETRTLSHLLHPPLLDEVGFVSAAKWFVEGFATRSGLLVRCDIPFDLPRFGNNSEFCLFRVLQETLTNAHAHSGCRALNIGVQFDSAKVILTVEDDGTGIPPDRLTLIQEGTGPLGIGLSGMKERICDLGGHMYVYSGEHGTTVRAVVPIPFRATAAEAQHARPRGVAA